MGGMYQAGFPRLSCADWRHRTFSAFHGWQEAHPDRMSREEGGPGDLIDEAFDEMLEAEPEWKNEGDKWMEKEVEVEWGSYILMAQRI